MNYDPNVAAVRQTDPWSCSIASTAFMLHSLGIEDSYPLLETLLRTAGLATPQDGLEDGSGSALAGWLAREYGVDAHSQRAVSWDWLQEHAGTGPCAIGSGSLYHWVAVRGVDGDGTLTLSNPAPGYRGLGDTMTEAQFAAWAPWACVWIAVEEAEDVGQIAELQQQIADAQSLLGTIQHEWADAVESAINDAKAEPNKAKRNADLDAALAALSTIRNGG